MLETFKVIFVVFVVASMYLSLYSLIFCRTDEIQFKLFTSTTVYADLEIAMQNTTLKKINETCPRAVSGLGPIRLNKTQVKLTEVEKKYPTVNIGGRYEPPCIATRKVAIIVPYRDRETDLALFLNNIHPFLMKQQTEYGIFVVEQYGNNSFNRAKLLNVGFVEATRVERWQCYVFHDVDLLPLDTRNLYSCCDQPKHMSVSVDTLHYLLPYGTIFGGVTAMTYEQFTRLNGYSNKFWGWGGEDDDMYYRLVKRGYNILRDEPWIAKYTMLRHKNFAPNPKRYKILSRTKVMFLRDGLSTLKYQLINITAHHLFTHIMANIEELR